ncbi:hypothetical protein BZA70DRAFT_287843 [Myxozyma melibiosi]|uniref:JmjC domain-containing protein n=1 Tax=Myxozyma melibiosi TaxID=54550 RepID=A0ABR1FF90_9ASCO
MADPFRAAIGPDDLFAAAASPTNGASNGTDPRRLLPHHQHLQLHHLQPQQPPSPSAAAHSAVAQSDLLADQLFFDSFPSSASSASAYAAAPQQPPPPPPPPHWLHQSVVNPSSAQPAPSTSNLFQAAAYGSSPSLNHFNLQSDFVPSMSPLANPSANGHPFDYAPADQDDLSRRGARRKRPPIDYAAIEETNDFLFDPPPRQSPQPKKLKSAQVRPPFANDKPVVVNPSPSEYWYTQSKNCQSMNVGVRRCRACTRRKSGVGACRFITVRVFKEDVSGPYYDGEDPDYGFRNFLSTIKIDEAAPSTGPDARIWSSPFLSATTFTAPPTSLADITYVLDLVSVTLQDFLAQELVLESRENLLRVIPKDADYRSLCDICGTSIFSGRFMCYFCGLEMCIDCFDDWRNLGSNPPDRKLARNTQQFVFEFCAYGNRHDRSSLVPVTRMLPGDLQAVYDDVSARIALGAAELAASTHLKRETAPLPPIAQPLLDVDKVLSHPKRIDFGSGELSIDQFREKWSEGMPLVIHGAGSALKYDWSDDAFLLHPKSGDHCTLLNETGALYDSTVREFFEGFKTGLFRGLLPGMRLKDWPVHASFEQVYPDLFVDFDNALPFPIYTRHLGFMNLASMFPVEANKPDLGPKLYTAYASSHAAKGRGSTTLHMDVTDACNIMCYSVANGSPDSLDNVPGADTDTDAQQSPPAVIGAVWDIFRAEDSDKIRQFILEREQEDPDLYHNPQLPTSKSGKSAPKTATDDPIHRQIFYLTDPELILLRKRYGVVPFRIWQKVGDAVFVPAGCAHQVCNLSSCVKAAIDFVSPENLDRSFKVMHETRNLARVKKKDDLLQFKQILFCAYIRAKYELRLATQC